MGKITKVDTSDIKKSRPAIPQSTVVELWSRSGGRCELCNEKLWRDGLTFHSINQSNIAHIIAQTPNGPRGNKDDSERLATDISNLMLVCAKHNKLFDTNEIVEQYTVKRLREIKKEHEERIDIATSIKPEMQTTPLIYTSSINNTHMSISNSEVRNALFPRFYPILDKRIDLNFEATDLESEFWKYEKSNLEKSYNSKIKPEFENGNIKHLSIFAMAPQPLLIYLGYLIGDKFPVSIYQLQRYPRSWGWMENGLTNLRFNVKKPLSVKFPPLLTISLSDKICEERIKEAIGSSYSRWDITIDNPNRDFLTRESFLYEFSSKISQLLDEIKNVYGMDNELKIIPIMPIATAIEFGRRIDPKYSMPIKIYNHNQNINKFEPVLTIGSQEGRCVEG